MTINYSYGKDRELELTVNDSTIKIHSLADDDDHHQLTVPVDLKPGYNLVRMGNSYNWAPDIDNFVLAKE